MKTLRDKLADAKPELITTGNTLHFERIVDEVKYIDSISFHDVTSHEITTVEKEYKGRKYDVVKIRITQKDQQGFKYPIDIDLFTVDKEQPTIYEDTDEYGNISYTAYYGRNCLGTFLLDEVYAKWGTDAVITEGMDNRIR